jgi:hypothetical protein
MAHTVEVRRKRYDERGRTSYYSAKAIYLSKGHYEEWERLDRRELHNHRIRTGLAYLVIGAMILEAAPLLAWSVDGIDGVAFLDFVMVGVVLLIEFFLVHRPRLRLDDTSCILQKKKILTHYGISATDPGAAAIEDDASYWSTWAYILRCD